MKLKVSVTTPTTVGSSFECDTYEVDAAGSLRLINDDGRQFVIAYGSWLTMSVEKNDEPEKRVDHEAKRRGFATGFKTAIDMVSYRASTYRGRANDDPYTIAGLEMYDLVRDMERALEDVIRPEPERNNPTYCPMCRKVRAFSKGHCARCHHYVSPED